MRIAFRASVRTRSTAVDYKWLPTGRESDKPDEWWTRDVRPKSLFGSPLGIASLGPTGLRVFLSHIPSARLDRIGSMITYDLALIPIQEENDSLSLVPLDEDGIRAVLRAWAAQVVDPATAPATTRLGEALDDALRAVATDMDVSVDVAIDDSLIDPNRLVAMAARRLKVAESEVPAAEPLDQSWIGLAQLADQAIMASVVEGRSQFAWSEIVDREMVESEKPQPEVTWLVAGEGEGPPIPKDLNPPSPAPDRTDGGVEKLNPQKAGTERTGLLPVAAPVGVLMIGLLTLFLLR